MKNSSPKRLLNGKIAWVTGAGRGIGRAIALALASKGARVVVSSRTASEIEDVREHIHQTGHEALAVTCDVTRSNEITSLVSEVQRSWGSIDILVNNAGLWVFTDVLSTTEEDWDLQMATNLKGPFLCTKAVLAGMIERGNGHIINIVSVAGKQPYTSCAAYCASKYGLLGFTDVLRMEVRKHGIKVTAVVPGATNTSGWDKGSADRARMLRPESVAEAVVAVCVSPPDAMPEEIVVRPIGGDL